MEKIKFEIKQEHLKLLKNFYINWDTCEFGVPTIDSKRPYGNSNVYQDMLNILGLEEIRNGVFNFKLQGQKWILKGEDKCNLYLDGADEENLKVILWKLHRETKIALQICLVIQRFEMGIYEADKYSRNWNICK